MAKVFHHLNRLVSSRYLCEKDISLFLKTIKHLSEMRLKSQPQVLILRSVSSLKKSFDILLDTGILPGKLNASLNDYSLFYYTLYSKEYYKTVATIDTSDLLSCYVSPDYATILFNRIANYIIENIDDSVELRGLKK